MDVVRIHRLELDCIVGIRPSERQREQRVRLDLGLHADLSAAGRTGRIALTADYDRVAHEVVALLSFRHYHLVEMAAEEVSAMLLGLHAGVHRVDLKIEKPGALQGRARAASVQVQRSREDFPFRTDERPHGDRQLLLETRDARLELLRVAPGLRVEGAPPFAAECLSWLSRGQLVTDNGPLGDDLPSGAVTESSTAVTPVWNPGVDQSHLFRCWRKTHSGH